METIEAIMTRRSVRRFDPTKKVDVGTMELLLRAAMAAPSAGNQRPWRFVVVRDVAQRMRLSESTPYASSLASAPVGIVVLCDARGVRWPDHAQQDCSAATENLLLAAHALGLGAVWLGVAPDEERMAAVAEIIGPDEGILPFCMISLGYPEQPSVPADRYEADWVREERWA